MREPCLPVEELHLVDRLPPEDSRRRHAEACPRCRARRLSFQSFVRSDAPPPGSRPEEARAALDDLVRRELSGSPRPRATAPRTGRRWTGLWFLVPAVTAAILLLVMRPGGRDASRREAPVMRGDAPATEAMLTPARATSDGGVEFRWRRFGIAGGSEAAPGGTYEVRFFSTDLTLVWQSSAQSDTMLALPAARLTAVAPPGSNLIWRVAAISAGEEVAVSEVGTFRVP